MIAQRYGAEPEITYFESPVIVDNEMGAVQVAAEWEASFSHEVFSSPSNLW